MNVSPATPEHVDHLRSTVTDREVAALVALIDAMGRATAALLEDVTVLCGIDPEGDLGRRIHAWIGDPVDEARSEALEAAVRTPAAALVDVDGAGEHEDRIRAEIASVWERS